MLFSTSIFVFGFLPLALVLYFVVHPRLRNALLLVASLIFYAWGEPVLSTVMMLSIVANYAFGRWVDAARAVGRGRGVLVLALAFNLGLLVFFKYADWLWDAAGHVLTAWGWTDGPWPRIGSYFPADSPLRTVVLKPDESIRLPVGISFFAFQGMSYVVDIYRRDVASEKSLIDFGMYKSFFPQLIAGPIVRYRDVHEQIKARLISTEGFAYGIRRFVLGLGKKVLIADVCAKAADSVFGNPAANLPGIPAEQLTPAVAWLGIVAYTLQLYFDFSGYSDMAIGLGRMVGFRFLENFQHPYVSRSITEFWRRWHMSLSTWFRDYLYVPLGGNRAGRRRTYVNLLFVFLLCGLWHGANYTFVIWGLYHGAFLVLERVGFGAWLERRVGAVRHAYVLLVVVVGWVFFRASNLGYALAYLSAMFGIQDGSQLVHVPHPPIDDAWYRADQIHTVALIADPLIWTGIVCGILGSMPWLPRLVEWHAGLWQRGRRTLSVALESVALVALLSVFALCAMSLAAGGYSPFIYFRF